MQKFENIKKRKENQTKNKEPKRLRENLQKASIIQKKKTKMFRPVSGLGDIGLKVLVAVLVLVFSMFFASCSLDLFGLFGFFGFPDGC